MATSIYGIWGNALVRNQNQFNQLLPYINGFNFRMSWQDLETSPGVFQWASYFDDQLDNMFDNNKYAGFMMYTGSNAPITGTVNWLAQAPYSVPIFTNDRGTYPYYFNNNYITRYYNMLDNILAHISGYSTAKKNKLLYWMSAEGTTGDTGPYKGTVPVQYQISDSDWQDFKREIWDYLYTGLASQIPNTRLLINPGNNGENFQYALDNYPGVWLKAGDVAHNYNLPGEKEYAARLNLLKDSPSTENRIRGEFEGTDDQPFWVAARRQNFLALAGGAIASNLDMLNIAYSTASSGTYLSDPYGLQFYTKYAGMRAPEERGFCMLRDIIDIADTTRFPETGPGSYGILITQNVSDYNSRKAAILSNGQPTSVQETQLVNLLLDLSGANYKYINPLRVSAIRAEFPAAGYAIITPDQQRDSYTNDYGVNMMPGNFEIYVSQIIANDTSEGLWRIGSTNQYFGRYARQFKLVNNQGEMFFRTEGLTPEGNNTVGITITYYDQGNGFWSLNCATCAGKTEIGVMQNTNTNTWKQVTFSTDYYLGDKSLENGADFTLKYLSGLNTPFSLIEFTRVS